jgi:Flp pilus assembly protein TadG
VNRGSGQGVLVVDRRARRGATLVLVVLCMTALLGLSALAIDFARLYRGVNELQTVADAAALRGALLIQKSPTTGAQNVAAVTAFATTGNTVLGGPVDGVDVQPYHYEEADPRKQGTLGGNWSDVRLNAVQVTVKRTGGLLMLGSLLNVVIPAPTRTATAWVANLTGNTCVRPWAFAIGYLINRADATVSNTVERMISPDEMAKLRAQAKVRFVLAPPGTVPNNGEINNKYGKQLYGGNWAALEFVDTRGGGSATSVFNTCSIDRPIREGDLVLPTSVAVQAVGNSLDKGDNPVCSTLAGSTCTKSNGSPGGRVVMSFAYNTADGVGSFGLTETHRVARVGSFVLDCYRMPGGGPTVGCSEADQYLNVNWNTVADGTILGYLDFYVPEFTGDYSLGTGAGSGGATQQRLILVNAPIRNAPAP